MESIGLDRKHVRIAEYDPQWATLFEDEKNSILEHTPGIILGIEHVGSTSVPGLCAKPLIDMAAGVQSLADADLVQDILEGLGYEYRGGQGRDDRILYAKGSRDNRTHMLHIIEYEGEEWKRLIAFRDLLRTIPHVAQEYGELKRELSRKFSEDRDMYKRGKNVFIEKVLGKVI